MIEGMDKEIDGLLRQMVKRDEPSANEYEAAGPHIDADEIAAFAESAVPESLRKQMTGHFADCGRCRRILAGVIGSEAAETASAIRPVSDGEVSAAPADSLWYKDLLSPSKLVWTFGTIAVIFAGFLAFFIVGNISPTGESELARTVKTDSEQRNGISSEEPESAPAKDDGTLTVRPKADDEIDGDDKTVEEETTRPGRRAGEVAPAPLGTPAPLARTLEKRRLDDAAAAGGKLKSTTERKQKREQTETDRLRQNEAKESADIVLADKPAAAPPPTREKARKVPSPVVAQNKTAGNESKNRRVGVAKAAGRSEVGAKKDNAPVTGEGATRRIGTKTFVRKDRVWYDQEFRGQKTINVRRGTKEFRKLDPAIRSVAQELAGTVVLVFETSAYRID